MNTETFIRELAATLDKVTRPMGLGFILVLGDGERSPAGPDGTREPDTAYVSSFERDGSIEMLRELADRLERSLTRSG